MLEMMIAKQVELMMSTRHARRICPLAERGAAGSDGGREPISTDDDWSVAMPHSQRMIHTYTHITCYCTERAPPGQTRSRRDRLSTNCARASCAATRSA